VRVGAAEAEVVTGRDGWATVRGEVSEPDVPIEAAVEAGGREHRFLLLPGEPGSRGPGEPDLAAASAISIRPGRASGLDLHVQPPSLRAAPGALAYVTVRREDAAGQPITDEEVTLTATDGTIGALRAQPDGSFLAEYTPPAVDGSRQVEITAT